ncbi:4-hydroxyphenylacetate 3-hydroxylase N-terminal domain-containing protein [Komagataeibacter rhaeticus]|nr:4-hydroxyphenylacetate 3-hydroxylase N-terminal domain-containing protein [Komagataeibacter rhaeticus]WPP21438.1 4-hydroxyphenylacetate 3-hydroxylase N-terminal domain-containing protein [Komagataeibacter rhaeticus]
MKSPNPPALRTGEAFKKSLDDGRKVWVNGRLLDKVTDEPALNAGIDLMASMFDDQFRPETQEDTTYFDVSANRQASRAWQVPRTKEDLADRRRMIEYTSRKTVGTFGRPPDLAPTIAVGLLAYLPMFRDKKSSFDVCQPDFAENIERFVELGRNTNLTAAESLTGPQNDRSSGYAAAVSLLKVVSVERDGVRVSGAKSVGSIAAQSNEIFFTNLAYGGTPPEACIWGSVPVASDGIRMVSREMLSNPGANPFDHPITCHGEEADQLIMFDNVFVPKDRIFNLGDPTLVNYYGPVCNWAHWHVLTRLAVKAEIFVGCGHLVLDVLGTGHIPAVQGMLGELIEYAQTLRAFIYAAEARGKPTIGEVMGPDVCLLTAGRLYSIQNYPRIIHVLQELCGQGLVMRFGKAAFDNPDIGHRLAELLPGHGVSGEVKEMLMNFIWDLTSSSLAGRVALFENVNSSPAPRLRDRLYREFDREGLADMVKKMVGMP